MKMTKSLFLAFAGLGLFACSNEDVVDNGAIQGEANVAVTINPADMGRALVAPTTAKAVTGTAVVTLQTLDGPQTRTITLPITDQNKTVTFEGVNGPGAISVNVNSYSAEGIALTAMNGTGVNAGLSAPMYASSNVVSTEEGWSFNDDTNTYTGSLSLKHEQVARLEFSGIKHVKDGDKDCWFKTITFDGLFLNNVKGSTSGTAISFNNWTEVVAETQKAMPCFDKVDATEGANFVDDGATTATTYPTEEGKCYAYNIVADDYPILTLCFSNITLTQAQQDADAEWLGDKGYATVATYKAKGSDIKDNAAAFGVTEQQIDDNTMYAITKFPAGYIYRVTDLKLTDHNIGQTIDGKPVNVVATITIEDWKLVTGEVEWN